MKSHGGTGSKGLSLIKKEKHLEMCSTTRQWHQSCLSPGMIQESKFSGRFQPLGSIRGSDSSLQNICARHVIDADDDGLSDFLNARGRLFGIAYRVLKCAAEAEDIVQEVWIRWQMTDRSAVRDAGAFLATTTMRLAINVLHSAHSRRETAAGPYLWDPADAGADPEREAERSEALKSAVVVLLEKLSPAELTAYVLREAFDYSYREVAKVLRVQEANARQLVTRARRHVADDQHSGVNCIEQRRFLKAFAAAAQKGTLRALESFFVGIARATTGKGGHPAWARSAVAGACAVLRPSQSPKAAAAA